MSVESTPLLTSILEIHSLSSGAIRLLLALYSFRNKANGRCCPKIATLRRRIGNVSDATARRWLRELRGAGVVEATRHRGYNSYRIDLGGKPCGNSGKPGADECRERSKMTGLDRSKMNGQDRSNVTGLEPSFLIEQTVLNRQGGTAAAEIASVVVENRAEEKPAAAAGGDGPENSLPNTAPAATVVSPMARALADELRVVHPQPGLPGRAAPEIERILQAYGEPREMVIERIRANHATWVAYWATLPPGKFIPQLWRWLKDGEWEVAAVIRKPAERAFKSQREQNDAKYAELLREVVDGIA